MSERTRLGLGVMGAGLALGGLGDMLLRGIPWGVNIFLWIFALVAAATALASLGWVEAAGEGRWFLPAALLFAAGFLWRDSPFLLSLDFFAALTALSLAAFRGRVGNVRLSGISEYLLGGVYTGVSACLGPLPAALRDVRWQEVASGRGREPVLAATRGLLLAAPVMLLFGALFVAADAVFEDLVRSVFDFDVAEIFDHAVLIGFLAWITAGFLWAALSGWEAQSWSMRRPAVLSLGILEVGIVLGLLDALFAAFVAVQVRYLFGGADVISAGLTYAEYARRGFFELAAVTALVLPLLLLAHWLLRAETRAYERISHERIFRALAGALVALLFVVMASALWRMYLYYDEFGLTQLRFYTTAFMFWLLVVVLWFLATVMRGRRERFAFGALLSGFAAVLLLNIVNPDAQIARTNIERLESGKRFDAFYLTTLSADAAPVLFERGDIRIGEKQVGEDVILRRVFLNRWSNPEDGWRTWNLSRARAEHLAQELEAGGSRISLTERAISHTADNMQRFEPEYVELSTRCCG